MPEHCPDHDELISLRAEFKEYRRGMEERLTKLNELREQVETDRQVYLRHDVYFVERQKSDQAIEKVEQRVDIIENWQARIAGIGIVIVVISAILGAFIERAIIR